MAEPHRPHPTASQPVPLLRNPAWAELAWLQHGFSTRRGGVSTAYAQPSGEPAADLNLGWTKEDAPANVEENRRRLIAAVAAHSQPLPRLITVRQVHSDRTVILPDPTLENPAEPNESPANLAAPSPLQPSPSDSTQPLCEGDGLITATPGLLLGIQTADCVPILLADTRLRVVAVFHAGWRGTVARIVERGVHSLNERFGSHPRDLSAAIGPAIGPCCYTVGEEVHTRFHAAFDYTEALFHAEPQSRTWKLDLWQANRRQLLAAGLAPESITTLTHCTACSTIDTPAGTQPGLQQPAKARQFFSYRAEAGRTGRMMSVIGIAADPASR